MAQITPTPSPTVPPPYTCYTYNWSENWWIAYHYDVTPNADGTKTVVYGGGGGHANATPPTTMPDMCDHNMPPNSPPITPNPYSGYIYPDTSYH